MTSKSTKSVLDLGRPRLVAVRHYLLCAQHQLLDATRALLAGQSRSALDALSYSNGVQGLRESLDANVRHLVKHLHILARLEAESNEKENTNARDYVRHLRRKSPARAR